MVGTVILLSPDGELRERFSGAMTAAGWRALGFSDGSSAFLCACGHVASLRAAVLDEAVEPAERANLLRRLRLLRSDLRTVLLSRGDGVLLCRGWAGDSLGPDGGASPLAAELGGEPGSPGGVRSCSRLEG